MTTQRDHVALVRFAVEARDWRLVELLARLLGRESAAWLSVAHRAYTPLAARLAWAATAIRIAVMEEAEQRAERFLARVPSYVWDGESLPVPIEDIADTHVGLLVRDVEDLAPRPGAPSSPADQALSGLLLPAAARSGSTRRKRASGRRDGASRSPTSSGTGGFTATPSRPSTAAPRSSTPTMSTGAPASPPAEDEANVFAAAVLMPARLIREQYVRATATSTGSAGRSAPPARRWGAGCTP